MRISPLSLESSGDAAEAWALFDRDTATTFAPGLGSELTVQLGGNELLTGLKVHGVATYSLRLQDAEGRTLAGPFDLAEGDEDRWNAIELPGPIEVENVRVSLTASGDAGPVGDVELWGLGAQPALAYAPEATPSDDEAVPAHIDVIASSEPSFTVSASGDGVLPTCVAAPFDLSRHPGVYRRAWIRYQVAGAFRPFTLTRALNSHSMTRGHWVRPNVLAPISYVYPIDPEQLALGTNEAHFCVPTEAGADVEISGLEILGELDRGSNLIESMTVAPRDGVPSGDATGLLYGGP